MEKAVMWIFIAIGGAIGAYIPVWLWNADPLGLASIFGGMIGGLVGIWAAYKLGH